MNLETQAIAIKALENTQFTTYWLSGEGKPEATDALAEDINCDLLIVGAGFCGLWAALQAKEKNPDRHVVVIEGAEMPPLQESSLRYVTHTKRATRIRLDSPRQFTHIHARLGSGNSGSRFLLGDAMNAAATECDVID